jgi:SAM-dependent methyltransferase
MSETSDGVALQPGMPHERTAMKREHLRYLVCPQCRSERLEAGAEREEAGRIETGTLTCAECGAVYPIVRWIPRFVPLSNYADGFGLQWTKHARTQYDSSSGTTTSRDRFFGQTGWPAKLRGETVLEVGCGSGRFTEQAAATGAMVVSIDLSAAVEANYASNGEKDTVLIVQADLFRLPVQEGGFDRLFCFGVLQHTPDPARAFFDLPQYVKPGGRLAVDVYRRWGMFKQLTMTKYWARRLTRRMAPERLYRYCERYLSIMWPVAKLVRSIPIVGTRLLWRLLIADYSGRLALSEAQLREWAVLDTFDMLSPVYDDPQTVEAVEEWFRKAGLNEIEVVCRNALVVGRGRRP